MSSAEPATSKLLVQTLNQFRSGIKQMSTKSNTATGWIRGERREGKQEPKLGTLTTPSSTWMDTRGQARRQTGAEAGDTDHPQLNRLTPQPQAVGARGGGGGGGVPEHLQPGGRFSSETHQSGWGLGLRPLKRASPPPEANIRRGNKHLPH